MSRLRIYALFGDGGQQAGLVAKGSRHEIHFSDYSLDNLIQRGDPGGISVNRDNLERVLAELEPFDAVFSDSPELVLLRFVRSHRGLAAKPWLVNEVDRFVAVEPVRRFVERHYGEDPLPEALAAPEVTWFTITPGLEEWYGKQGMDLGALFYLPMARSSIRFFFPETIALQDELICGQAGPMVESPVGHDAILALGSHERDYPTLVAALAKCGLQAEAICNLALYPHRPAGPVRWHDSLPPAGYLESIRRARMIVLPLGTSTRALGQLSCALPMRMGKAILASRVPSLVAHLVEDRTGLTYPIGDSTALASQLKRLAENDDLCDRLGSAAKKEERRLAEVARDSLDRMLARLLARVG